MGRKNLSKSEQKVVASIMLGIIIIWLLVMIFQWMTEHLILTISVAILIIGTFVLLFIKNERFNNFLKRQFQRRFSFVGGMEVFGKIDDAELQKLVDAIKAMDTLTILGSEKHFETQIYQFLKGKGYDVKEQVTVGNNVIDMVVNSRIGIELKLARSTTTLRNLEGQAREYTEKFEKLIVVIVDIGEVSDTDVNTYAQKITDVRPDKIVVVVVKQKAEYEAKKIIEKNYLLKDGERFEMNRKEK